MCKLSITDSGSGEGSIRTMYKKFVKEDFIGVKMVLLLPDPKLAKAKSSLISTIEDSCKKKGVRYGVVYYKDNTPENWKYLFQPPPSGSRKDIYYGGHANSQVGGVQRTYLECYKNGEKIYAFSYTTKYELGAQPLPDNWDEKGFDLRELGLKDYDQIEIGWFDGCRTAGRETKTPSGIIIKTPYTDLAETFGFLSTAAQGNHCSIFFGWRMDPKLYPGFNNFGTCFSAANHGQEIVWGNRGLGGGYSIQHGIDITDYEEDETVQYALWGEDTERDCLPDGDDNLFTYGFGDLSNMKLQW